MSSTLTLKTPYQFLDDYASEFAGGQSEDSSTDETWNCRNPALIGPAAREKKFREAIQAIEGFCALKKGFDGYGGLGATKRAAQYGIDLLNELLNRPQILPPYVTPISTGEYIDWKTGDEQLCFEIQDDSVLIEWRSHDCVMTCDEDDTFDVGRAVELVEGFHRCGFVRSSRLPY